MDNNAGPKADNEVPPLAIESALEALEKPPQSESKPSDDKARKDPTPPVTKHNEIRTPPAATTIGDLRFPGCFPESVHDSDEVLVSDPSVEPRTSQKAKFNVAVFEENGTVKMDVTLVQCWVDKEGQLNHYHTYERGKMHHDEETVLGDAFVVYAHRPPSKDGGSADESPSRPETIEELKNHPDLDVLFSYRLREAVGCTQNHLIRCFARLSRAPGGLRGAMKYKILFCAAAASGPPDNEYRIEISLPPSMPTHRLPTYNKPWEISYLYVCPPIPELPVGQSWSNNKGRQVFYVWGDVDFDDYGPRIPAKDDRPNARALHDFVYNQIVPQTMIGNCLSSNDENYCAKWDEYKEWVIQAQYFWKKSSDDPEEGSKAQCGPVIPVKPGALIRTRISYNPNSGVIFVSIGVVSEEEGANGEIMEVINPLKQSVIHIPRPFPNDPMMFTNWNDFFRRCEEADKKDERERPKEHKNLRGSDDDAKKRGPLGRPYLNVEYKGSVDIETLKSVCPFVVREAIYPSAPAGMTPKWKPLLFSPRTGRGSTLADESREHVLELKDAVVLGRESSD